MTRPILARCSRHSSEAEHRHHLARGAFTPRRQRRFGSRIQVQDPFRPREARMDEDRFNMELRKFLKTVGVTSQRELENAVRQALAARKIKGDQTLKAKMVLTVPAIGLSYEIDGTIALG
jgi:hypothetical protein